MIQEEQKALAAVLSDNAVLSYNHDKILYSISPPHLSQAVRLTLRLHRCFTVQLRLLEASQRAGSDDA